LHHWQQPKQPTAAALAAAAEAAAAEAAAAEAAAAEAAAEALAELRAAEALEAAALDSISVSTTARTHLTMAPDVTTCVTPLKVFSPRIRSTLPALGSTTTNRVPIDGAGL
jgi:hypothetical protein